MPMPFYGNDFKLPNFSCLVCEGSFESQEECDTCILFTIGWRSSDFALCVCDLKSGDGGEGGVGGLYIGKRHQT